ncbi:MAG: cyclic nucleotide-binding domain-containing protein [Elusimicrobiota bacterium]
MKLNVELLSFFNEEQLRRVTPDIERRTYAKGEPVLFRGEITSGLYLVKKGKAVLQTKTESHALAPGDFFGEMSVLEDVAAAESVRAAEDGTEVLTIPHNSFAKLLKMQPLLKKALLDKAAKRKKRGAK